MNPVLVAASILSLGGHWYRYRVTLGPASGAQATLALADPIHHGTKDLVPVRGAVEPEGIFRGLIPVRGEIVTYIDARSLLPARMEFQRQDARTRVQTQAEQKKSGQILLSRQMGKKAEQVRKAAGAPVYDPLSALFWARTQPWKPGTKRTLLVLDGMRLVPVVLVGGEVENLRLPAGTQKALRIDGTARYSTSRRLFAGGSFIRKGKLPDRRFRLWLSIDETRLPLKLETDTPWGKALVELSASGPALDSGVRAPAARTLGP